MKQSCGVNNGFVSSSYCSHQPDPHGRRGVGRMPSFTSSTPGLLVHYLVASVPAQGPGSMTRTSRSYCDYAIPSVQSESTRASPARPALARRVRTTSRAWQRVSLLMPRIDRLGSRAPEASQACARNTHLMAQRARLGSWIEPIGDCA